MKKIDFKKELKHLYKASAKKIEIVDVPAMNFLLVDGKGNPNTSERFQQGVEALFGLSYTMKFMIKKGDYQIDYGVLPLEGLWWADNMAAFSVEKKSDWKWTAMIMQPEMVTDALIAEAREQVRHKKKTDFVDEVRFEAYEEGRAVQILHIGPFEDEGPTIEKLHQFIDDSGYARSGKHHEIYLSDIRRAAPEKWRTIIRQPF